MAPRMATSIYCQLHYMEIQSKIPLAGSIVAFVIAALTFLPAIKGQIFVIPFAFIPLIAGIGIKRRRVWSAYGFAVFLFAQLLLLPVIFRRPGNAAVRWTEAAALVVFSVVLTLFFFAVGRWLAAEGSPRGRALPWIVVSALCTLPFFFVQAFAMPSGSMENTLLIGDRILVRRFPRIKPERGDIVAFVYPLDRSQSSVKRIIGLPGDHIKIFEESGLPKWYCAQRTVRNLQIRFDEFVQRQFSKRTCRYSPSTSSSGNAQRRCSEWRSRSPWRKILCSR